MYFYILLWSSQVLPCGLRSSCCGSLFLVIKSWLLHKVRSNRCPSSSPSITPPVGPRSHLHFLIHDHPSRRSCYMTNAFTRPTLWVEGVSPQNSLLHIPLYPYCAMFHTSGRNSFSFTLEVAQDSCDKGILIFPWLLSQSLQCSCCFD